MKKSTPNPWFIPSILFFLSFFLRLSLISKGAYNIDCLGLAIAAQRILEDHQLQYVSGTGYPIAALLTAFFNGLLQIVGIKDYVLGANLMSVVVSSLCIPAMYCFVKKLLDERTAFFSAITLSLFPIFLGVSVYGMSHAPSVFFLLLGFFFLVSYLKSQRPWPFLLAAVFLACMGGSRPQEFTLMTVPISYLFLFSHRIFAASSELHSPRKRFIQLFLFWMLTGSIIFLLHLPYLMPSSRQAYLQQLQNYTQLNLWENFKGLFSRSLSYSLQLLFLCLTPVGALLSGLGLAQLSRRNIHLFIFFLLWFFVPLSFLGNLSMTVGRFLIIPVLALVIAQSYSINYLTRFNNRIFQISILLIYCLINALLFSRLYPILKFRHDKALLTDMAHYINRKTEPDAQIISGDVGLFIQYYGHRTSLNRPTHAVHIDPTQLDKFKITMDKLLANGVPVYITESGLLSYNPHKKFSNFMERHYELQYVGEFPSEDWHQGDLSLRLGIDALYKISAKKK